MKINYNISRLQGLLDINGPLDSVIPQKLSFREGIFSTLLIVLYIRDFKVFGRFTHRAFLSMAIHSRALAASEMFSKPICEVNCFASVLLMASSLNHINTPKFTIDISINWVIVSVHSTYNMVERATYVVRTYNTFTVITRFFNMFYIIIVEKNLPQS